MASVKTASPKVKPSSHRKPCGDGEGLSLLQRLEKRVGQLRQLEQQLQPAGLVSRRPHSGGAGPVWQTKAEKPCGARFERLRLIEEAAGACLVLLDSDFDV